jgi:hypothetical protein
MMSPVVSVATHSEADGHDRASIDGFDGALSAVNVQAAAPPVGFIDVKILPEKLSTATHIEALGHEIAASAVSLVPPASRVFDHVGVALVGLVETNTAGSPTAPSIATHNETLGHEIPCSSPAFTRRTVHALGPDWGRVEVASAFA